MVFSGFGFDNFELKFKDMSTEFEYEFKNQGWGYGFIYFKLVDFGKLKF